MSCAFLSIAIYAILFAIIDSIAVSPLSIDNKSNKSLKEILRKEDQKIKLLFVGNLFKYKNIQFLIKNFVELKNEFPNINLQIIGDGEYKENIVKIINELNLNKNIQLLGRVSDEELRKYYSFSSIYLYPRVYTNCSGRGFFRSFSCSSFNKRC